MKIRDKTALIVFAREPVAGRIKTRLEASVGRAMTLRLYRSFVRDILDVAGKCEVDKHYLFTYGRSTKGKDSFFMRYKKKFIIRQQRGANLGERMLRALQQTQKAGAARIVIIGSDCLDLSVKVIAQAFDQLKKKDIVFGPSLDGGYYLIGCTKPFKSLFSGIPWGTEEVLAKTLLRCQRLRREVVLLSRRGDIDTLKDLQRYFRKAQQGTCYTKTAKFLLVNKQRLFYTNSVGR